MKDAVLLVPVFIAGACSLFAMADAPYRHPDTLPFHLLFLGFLFGILVVWHRGKQQSVERARGERPAPASWSPGWVLTAIGAGVPIGVFAIAWLATLSARHDVSVVWFGASAVSITVLVCGTFLLTRVHGSPFNGPAHPGVNGKHAEYDPDRYDVVGRRG